MDLEFNFGHIKQGIIITGRGRRNKKTATIYTGGKNIVTGEPSITYAIKFNKQSLKEYAEKLLKLSEEMN